MLNLASVMVMRPSILVLDEPTSQLDPIAASEFLETIQKINRDMGTTVVLSEHRLEEVLPMADRLLVLDEGRLIVDDAPKQAALKLYAMDHPLFCAMPAPLRISAHSSDPALTVREGRAWLRAHKTCDLSFADPALPPAPIALELKDVYFRYEKDAPDVLRGANLKIAEGSLFALLGSNGAGKTTALGVLCGRLKPQHGSVSAFGRSLTRIPQGELYGGLVSCLPQYVQSLFLHKNVGLELSSCREASEQDIQQIAQLCGIGHLFERNPFDLSGGEQQRVALAKVLLKKPRIVLLDEPTKGMDADFKEQFAGMLKELCKAGMTVVMMSHDVAFCARHADVCALFFDGDVVSQGQPHAFFKDNYFYTTAASRMARDILTDAINAEEVTACCE